MIRILLVALLPFALQSEALPIPAPRPANYVVGASDVLTVTVFNEPQLSGRFKVDADGRFSYPFLGRIVATGATTDDIAGIIRAGLGAGYLRDPQVAVDVEVFRRSSVFVMGEVRAPGKYMLSGTGSLVEVLAQAGSITPTAGNEVLVLHSKEPAAASPTVPGPDADIQRVDLGDIQSGMLSANVEVHDGDTVFVPKALRVYVTGYVRNPGSFAYEPNLTVLRAISIAGGLTDRGSSGRVRIIRNKKEIDATPADLVQPDDTIVVRQRLL